MMQCPLSLVSRHSQTDDEGQQALQSFTTQSFMGSPPQSTFSSSGSAASLPPFPSPTGLSETRPKTKKGPRKNQNEKYRLKYLRLRKAALAMIFVSTLHTKDNHLNQYYSSYFCNTMCSDATCVHHNT